MSSVLKQTKTTNYIGIAVGQTHRKCLLNATTTLLYFIMQVQFHVGKDKMAENHSFPNLFKSNIHLLHEFIQKAVYLSIDINGVPWNIMFETKNLLLFILTTDLLELTKYMRKSVNVPSQHNCILKLLNPCIVAEKL